EGRPAVMFEAFAIIFEGAWVNHLLKMFGPMVKIFRCGQTSEATISLRHSTFGAIVKEPLLIALIADDAAVIAAFGVFDAGNRGLPMDAIGAGGEIFGAVRPVFIENIHGAIQLGYQRIPAVDRFPVADHL